MHIPDGYLGPETVAAGWAACAPAWYIANRRAKEALSEPKAAPMLAASAAFSFLVMMLNIPVFGGTSAHATGAVLIAIVAGPWVAVLAVTAALVIQALLFADGGILALGVNCLVMAVAMPFAGYAVYRLIARGARAGSPRQLAAAGAGAYAASVLGGLLVALALGIQPILHSVDGVAQYAPYGLEIAVPAMLLATGVVAGPVEALFTVGVLAFLARTAPELLGGPATTARPRLRPLWTVVAVFLVVAPLGLLAAGTAWGEWSAHELEQKLGYVPSGFVRFGEWWTGVLPDYGLPGGEWQTAAYVLSALLGVALLAGLAWLLVRLLWRRGRPRSGRKTAAARRS